MAVRQALGHLDDLLFLRWSPLVGLLGLEQAADGAGEVLQRVLIDAVEAMRPAAPGAPDAPAWRRWRCLSLRYVQAEPPERILQELGISARQMRRDQLEAIGELASALWTRARARQAVGVRASGAPHNTASAAPAEADVARMGASAHNQPVDVVESLEWALAVVARLADRHGASFALELAEDLGAVTINRGVLRQVLVALLSYAAEAMPGARVQVRAAGRPGSAHLSLRAQGSCCAAPDPSRLSISQQLIGMQGGTVEWRADAGRDLAIDVHLPAAERATVLVVDDNPDFGALFERYLQRFGYRVVQAADGEGALQLARTVPPDVVALDLMIPDQDGWEILQRLQSCPETRDVPVVVCSALPEEELALSLGAAEFLAKPVSQQALVDALDRCRARRAARPGSPSGSPSAARPEGRPAG